MRYASREVCARAPGYVASALVEAWQSSRVHLQPRTIHIMIGVHTSVQALYCLQPVVCSARVL